MGFGLNARGAMEIILGLLALEAGVINERLFVALVTMALLTSMTSGTLLERALQRRRPMRLVDRVAARHFVPSIEAQTREDVIRELAENAAPSAGRPAEEIAQAVLARESLMSTGIGNRVAIPHARMEGLKAPLVVIGRSHHGIDFDAPDGRDARIVFLILTSAKSYSDQLEILADISRALHRPDAVEKALASQSYAELLALLKVESGGEHAGG
jgi:mannitol/fructose-specific phosphotransferase system IIA component (Ntr-type)